MATNVPCMIAALLVLGEATVEAGDLDSPVSTGAATEATLLGARATPVGAIESLSGASANVVSGPVKQSNQSGV
jgi:hypothetical protein